MILIIAQAQGHEIHPVETNGQYQLVIEEVGLMYNALNNQAMTWVNNNPQIEKAVTAFLHQLSLKTSTGSNNYTFKPKSSANSTELKELEARLHEADQIPEGLEEIRQMRIIQANILSQIALNVKYGPFQSSFLRKFHDSEFIANEQPLGTIYQVIRILPFPWDTNLTYRVPSTKNQLLLVPLNKPANSFEIDEELLIACKTIKSLYLCSFNQLPAYKSSGSCLDALYRQDYQLSLQTCSFVFQSKEDFSEEFVYQLNQTDYLIFTPVRQFPTYKCTGNIWDAIRIPQGISRLTINPDCDLKLQQHVINTKDTISPIPVIKLAHLKPTLADSKIVIDYPIIIIQILIFYVIVVFGIFTIVHFITKNNICQASPLCPPMDVIKSALFKRFQKEGELS